LAPKILNADRAYIATYQTAIDEATLLAEHGSGRYLVILNDTRLRKCVNKAIITVYNTQAPPRVRLQQLLAIPENDSWRTWLEEVEAAKPSKRESEVSEDASGGVAEAVRGMTEITQTALTQAAEGKREAPMDRQLAELTLQTLQRMGDMAHTKEQSIDVLSLLEKATTLLEKQRTGTTDGLALLNAVLGAVEKIQRPAQPTIERKSVLQEAKELAEGLAALREVFASGGGVEVSNTLPVVSRNEDSEADSVFAGVVSLLKDVVRTVGGPIGHALGGALAVKLAALPASSAGIPGLAAVAGNATAAGAAGSPAVAAGDTATGPSIGSAEILQIMQLALNAFNRGLTGAEFSDSFSGLYGEVAYQQVASLGEEGIMAQLRAIPAIWNQCAAIEPQLREFIQDFLTPPSDEDEEDAGDQDSAPVA
jgi:hypothetical protein